MKTPRTPLRLCLSALALVACSSSSASTAPAAAPDAPRSSEPAAAASGDHATPGNAPELTPEAAAPAEGQHETVQIVFQAKSGAQLSGSGTLTQTSQGVTVALALENAPPGAHGAHVHEKGDCSAADASSAGGHFNPAAHPHALPDGSPRHLGDLGNIQIGDDGNGALDIVAPGANLKPSDPSSFRGKAIVIHEKADDGGQPTGNAGGRIGCAVIE